MKLIGVCTKRVHLVNGNVTYSFPQFVSDRSIEVLTEENSRGFIDGYEKTPDNKKMPLEVADSISLVVNCEFEDTTGVITQVPEKELFNCGDLIRSIGYVGKESA